MARETKKTSGGRRWRFWLGGIAALGVCGSTAVAAYKVHDYAVTSPSFTLSRELPGALTIEGLHYTVRSTVLHVFDRDFNHSIFSTPLAERRRRLLGIDWVEDASVSRVWPDRLIVRIRERRPVAFVSFRTGVLLIDAHGVLLDPPAQSHFSFPVLSGIREDQDEAQRAECVQTLLRLQRELGGRAGDISEVDTVDPDDVRVVAHVDNQTVELLLGDSDFDARYRRFLSHFAEIRKKSPEGKIFDLRLDDRITVKE
jgi:cell division protein FtsQ